MSFLGPQRRNASGSKGLSAGPRQRMEPVKLSKTDFMGYTTSVRASDERGSFSTR